MSDENIKKKKKRHRKRKKKNVINTAQTNHNCNCCSDDKKCNCGHDHNCDCENCTHNNSEQIQNNNETPEYCEYDFMKLDTIENKEIFCQKLYSDIIECYETFNHDKIRNTMNVINKYFLYQNQDDETLLDTEMLGILKRISNNSVKPIWERVTSGVGINIHVGLEYKGMVFSLCRDYE